jgi:putative tryptophan/tyrosine transport system substrate-binding protein
VLPLAARAQQPGRVRRVGMLRGAANVETLAEIAAFRESLAKLGWVDGRNLEVDVRFSASICFGVVPPSLTTSSAAPR